MQNINLGIRATAEWEGPFEDVRLVVKTYLTNVGGSFDIQIARTEHGRYSHTLEEAEAYAVKQAIESFGELIKEHMNNNEVEVN